MKKIIFSDILLALLIAGLLLSTKTPAKVEGLTVSETSYNTVALSWEESKNAQRYSVHRTEDGENYELISSTTDTTFEDTNLETGKTYTYKVVPASGLKRADDSNEVKATPALESPEIECDTTKGQMEISISDVDGAQGYRIYRDGTEVGKTSSDVFIDKTAIPDKEYKYEVKAYRKKSDSPASNTVDSVLTSIGEVETKIRGDEIIFDWGDNYESYKVYNGDELLTETKESAFSIPAEIDSYDIKIKGYSENTQSPEFSKKFEVAEEPMDNKTAIQNAIDWAVDIAADDSFTYGKKPITNRVGCYFCGTNQRKKPKGYEKTYVCMTFVTAAYAHGAKDPEIYEICSKGKMCLSLTDSNFTKFSCWKKVGLCKNLSVSDLEPGDVIVWYDPTNGTDGHMSMYIGDGNICDASGGGWGAGSISVKEGRATSYLRHSRNKYSGKNYVMRYTGKGSGTMKVIKDVES